MYLSTYVSCITVPDEFAVTNFSPVIAGSSNSNINGKLKKHIRSCGCRHSLQEL